jgi:uncharacterized protein involved in outer membrane biogenesis/gas vesicle protein
MKNILKWLGILSAALVVLIVAASVALALFFPLDRIKDIAASKISEALGRQVKIEKASFNIFTGLRLEKISVSEKYEHIKRPFIAAEALELHYDLWPLLRRQIVIRKIGLVKPEIFVQKSPAGDYNFSDMITNKKTGKSPRKENKDLPFELFVNSFYIKSGRLVYSDPAAGMDTSVNNFDLSVGGFTSSMNAPLDIRTSLDVNYQGKKVPVVISCKAALDLPQEKISVSPLALSVAGERVAMSIKIANFSKGPDISLDVKSGRISVDPLMAIFSSDDKKPKEKADITKAVDRFTSSIPRSLKAKVSADISNLTFRGITIDKAALSFGLANKMVTANIQEIKFYEGTLSGTAGINLNVPGTAYETKGLKLTGFNAHPFSNAVIDNFLTKLEDHKDLRDKLHGKIDISATFSGRGVDTKVLLKNLDGRATLSVVDLELKKTKILSSIGDLINSNMLKQDIKAGKLDAAASIKDGTVNFSDLALDHKDIRLNFKGGIDLERLRWSAGNRLTLALPPHATKDLSREYNLLRDASGWLEVTFELTGSLKMPIPRPVLDKPIERAVKKVEEKIQTVIDEQKEKAEAAARQKAEEEAERLKKEAADEIKRLLKF